MLLLPIGIDIPTDIVQVASLESLTQYRGHYAHHSSGVDKPITPEDAHSCVMDVKEMFIDIANTALKIKYFKYK